MVPHDQQVAVASPGTIREELGLDSRFAINTLAMSLKISRGLALPESGAVERDIAGESPFDYAQGRSAPRAQPENEVPQPQDFDEFGFTNTKPCCMSVSW